MNGYLYRLNNLQKRSINYSHASQDDLAGLVNIRQLVELEAAGIGLNSETLTSCLRRGMLDRLDRDGFLRHLAKTHGNVSDFNAEYKKIRGYIDHNQFIDVKPESRSLKMAHHPRRPLRKTHH